MKISWIVAADHQIDPTVDLDRLKAVGPVWGSWRTWRSCATDNVICHDRQKCRELLDRAFQAVCNFYLPRSMYETLSRPLGIRMYDGDFEREVDHIEDIIAMHLAGSSSDIVLMLGYDFSIPENIPDRFDRHKFNNRHGLMHSAILNMPQTQWVAVDCEEMDPSYQNLPNLTRDSYQNVLQLLI